LLVFFKFSALFNPQTIDYVNRCLNTWSKITKKCS